MFFLWVSFLFNSNLLKCIGSPAPHRDAVREKANTMQRLLKAHPFQTLYEATGGKEEGSVCIEAVSEHTSWVGPLHGEERHVVNSMLARKITHLGSPSQMGYHFREGTWLKSFSPSVSSLVKSMVEKWLSTHILYRDAMENRRLQVCMQNPSMFAKSMLCKV